MLLTQDPKHPFHYNEDTQEEEEEEEEEEALSLCDLPIHKERELEEDTSNKIHHTTPDHQLFEFFNDLSTDMCAAEDIFLSGKLLPFKTSVMKDRNGDGERSFLHIRSESLDETRGSRPKFQFMRSSFSVDYGKASLQKQTQMTGQVANRNRNGIGEISGGRASSRPKWYLLMFGSMRAPMAMEMKDIRSRQRRLQPPPTGLFPALGGGEGAFSCEKEEEEGRSPWKLLRALSCKGHADVVVTASFGSISHVRSR